MDVEGVRRAAVALTQARGHLPQGLRRRPRGQGWHRRLDRLLQQPAPASGARQPHADGGMARRYDGTARREAATSLRYGILKQEDRAARDSNQDCRSSGSKNAVHFTEKLWIIFQLDVKHKTG